MAKCKRCGKKGFFLRLNQDGICSNCERIVLLEQQEMELQYRISELNNHLQNQEEMYQDIFQQAKNDGLKAAYADLEEIQNKIEQSKTEFEEEHTKLESILNDEKKSQKNYENNSKKALLLQTRIKSMQYAIEKYFDAAIQDNDIRLPTINEELENTLSPTVNLKLHCMDIKQLRKRYKDNQKLIQETLEKYESRYTTKANIAIYRLMVMALEAELQNILYNLNYGKLEDAVSNIKQMTEKYLSISTSGNQNIAPTMVKFIGEIEYLFIESINIEYEYFVQKERIKEEQRALREQMRQEAEERKVLEQQKKQVEKEETKYKNEMSMVEQQISQSEDQQKIDELQQRLAELQNQLEHIEDKKDEIVSRQNGKAGYVYIISNIGSFGNNVFKVGMTRRLEPQDRVDELGDASVPFPFDVHSFIFSDDAVGLESTMHKMLNEQRVNKVNLRKEFFNITLDEIEKLVYQLQPSAEFNRTALAEQYRQSLSITDVPAEVSMFDNESEEIAV